MATTSLRHDETSPDTADVASDSDDVLERSCKARSELREGPRPGTAIPIGNART